MLGDVRGIENESKYLSAIGILDAAGNVIRRSALFAPEGRSAVALDLRAGRPTSVADATMGTTDHRAAPRASSRISRCAKSRASHRSAVTP
jgi:hypothetical protein